MSILTNWEGKKMYEIVDRQTGNEPTDPHDSYDSAYESVIKQGYCPDCGERQDSPTCCCYSKPNKGAIWKSDYTQTK